MEKKRILTFVLLFVILVLPITILFGHREKLGKILLPILMAIIIAYLLHPLVKRLERKKIPCSVSILLIYLFFSTFLGTAFIFILPQVINNARELITTLPEITAKYQGIFNRILMDIESSDWPEDVKNTLFREIQNGTTVTQNYIVDLFKKSLAVLMQTVTALFDFVLAMIIAYYLMKDADFFKEALLSLIPRKWRNGIVNTGRQVNVVLSNFIQGQIMTALIVGILEAIGLWIVKIKYPFVLGLVGGIANIIPYFGPFLGAVPAVAVALTDSPAKALWAVLVFIIIQQIDNAFISPKIIEGRLGLHPVTTIIAVLIGGEFYGIFGMLLAVPAAAIMRIIVKGIVEAVA